MLYKLGLSDDDVMIMTMILAKR